MAPLAKPVISLVTPGTRDANNGNWRTAARWSRMLRDRYRIIVQTAWDHSPADAMIALHARRSAASIAEFRSRARRPLAVVLTGTDLYRDLLRGGETARSLDLADQLVVLQDDAPRLLEPRWRGKCRVIFQSAEAVAHRPHAGAALRCVAVGHLREEKDPATVFRAMEALPAEAPIQVRHIGAPLDDALAAAARALAARDRRYRYAGALPHGLARAAIAAADVLIHPSIMEGGANVIVEAVMSDTPVVASRMSGNVGMLGAEYPAYFDVGDAQGLATLLLEAAEGRSALRAWKAACRRRKPLFKPARERREVLKLLDDLLA
jgi:putative glycosyltransferase (TIGR04348 family)